MPRSPDRGCTGVSVDREELTGDELAVRELGSDRRVDLGQHGGRIPCWCRRGEPADGHVRQHCGREVVAHGIEDPDDRLARSNGVIERVTGHPVDGCRIPEISSAAELNVSGGSSDQRNSAATERGLLRRVAEMTSP